MSDSQLVFLDVASLGDDLVWPDFGRFGAVVNYPMTRPNEVIERIADAAFIFTNKVVITAEHIAAAPKLRYIGVFATGYNQVDIEAAAKRRIPVCNVPDYSSYSVTQHVFSLLLSLTSDVCRLAASTRAGEWSKAPNFSYWFKPGEELAGKTMGIVGFGNIGVKVGAVAHSLGMSVLVYNPRPKPAPAYQPFAFVDLPTLFRESDVVTLHCPLTEENTGMVNAALLKTMKPTAYLINAARGPLVNDQDLAEALTSGRLAGAGLDVVSVEPMRDDNPLRLAPNCVITPHVAWTSVEARTRLLQGVYDNVAAFVQGKPQNVKDGV